VSAHLTNAARCLEQLLAAKHPEHSFVVQVKERNRANTKIMVLCRGKGTLEEFTERWTAGPSEAISLLNAIIEVEGGS
jgi:hypothetical protein